jgi:hypothetical protein
MPACRRLDYAFPPAALVGALLTPVFAIAFAQAPATADAAWLAKIRDEGLNRSQVMTVASWLTDVYGPRLTGSPWTKEAADWTIAQLRSWGADNPHLESWDLGGRDWVNERMTAVVLSPRPFPLIAYVQPWSPGTNGAATGEVARLLLDSLPDFDKYRGKLRGKWVMIGAPRPTRLHTEPDAYRWSQATLDSMEAPRVPQAARPAARPPFDTAAERRVREVRTTLNRGFLETEGALGILWQAPGDDGTVFQDGSSNRRAGAKQTVPQIWLASEHYGRIWRTLEKGLNVAVEIDARVRFSDDSTVKSFNIVADLSGTDKRDEVVMLGAHFDSWATGTGATDNAAGCAVMLEALRILRATGLPLRRTVRVALWTGEEQNYLGSVAYAREHFGYVDSTGNHFKPEQSKVTVYFNVDGGAGAIRGAHLAGDTAAAPMFREWLSNLGGLGATTISQRRVGGSDNVVFDGVGIPAFAFIQDPLDYESRTHHTNMDTFERLPPKDLMQNAVIVAALAYQAANSVAMVPRP